jgi:hypothetical protein
MSKKIQFTVSITFSEKVTDDQDILDIAKKGNHKANYSKSV